MIRRTLHLKETSLKIKKSVKPKSASVGAKHLLSLSTCQKKMQIGIKIPNDPKNAINACVIAKHLVRP